MSSDAAIQIGEKSINPGQTRDIRLKISEVYTGDSVTVPIRVIRAERPGPAVFVTAAVHGNEINGTGIIRELMFDEPLAVTKGTLMLVPVVNVFGFEVQNRYMPDRRDLNRSFPGTIRGSLTRRVAKIIFDTIVRQCDFGIDLHSAAAQRTNFPNVRGDLSVPGVKNLARAFGCELIVNSKGPDGSLRREACNAGCPTIILEAGEPWKIEPGVLDLGCQCIRNALIDLGMCEGEPTRPAYQTRVDRTKWVRAQVGGLLRFHVSPGDLVEKDQPLATNTSIFGKERNVLTAPMDGIVLGMTTLPTIKPGEPVVHLAIPKMKLSTIRNALAAAPDEVHHQRLREDLSTNVSVHRLPG